MYASIMEHPVVQLGMTNPRILHGVYFKLVWYFHLLFMFVFDPFIINVYLLDSNLLNISSNQYKWGEFWSMRVEI